MLLRLPDDVLLEIFDILEFTAVLACQATFSKLRMTFLHSAALQYKIELGACGMIDGAREQGSPDTSERLERLRRHAEACRSLKWTECTPLPHLRGDRRSASAVVGSTLVFPQGMQMAPQNTHIIQDVPSQLRGVQERHMEFIINAHAGHVDVSQDLFAYLQLSELSPDSRSYRYHFRSLSSGDVHPLAWNGGALDLSTPHLYRRRHRDVYGDCLLDVVYENRMWRYVVLNWKTGIVEWTQPRGQNVEGEACYFLDDSRIIGGSLTYRVDVPLSGQILQFRNTRTCDGATRTFYLFCVSDFMIPSSYSTP
ncbi:hypothetical protein BV25DRAFT_896838 [Artomyces pyxidatus]|uniref:Uncharacterized protein n=1 Tax=Artomyces pyxidatus TaxID=48021 RepID=A0ACB8SYK9_9AGAM|nr:hypothetical protein BV25DRAFT_896838 [Artomyces pyxidatus]